MRDGLEYRCAVELRAVGRRLAGYAATFGVIANIGGRFNEKVIRGAFTKTLATRADILALVDHDATKLLGRTTSGTLRLAEDARGLAFEIDVPETQLGRDMLTMAARNDLGGMSIGFHATSESWPTPDTRELRAIDLVEISIAQAWPAYSGTEIALRNRTTSSGGRTTPSRDEVVVSPVSRARLLALI
jgi:HK97 family phage prohead protease